MIQFWTRRCQECGHTQKSLPPKSTPSDGYLGAKCHKCESPALDFGKPQEPEEPSHSPEWTRVNKNEKIQRLATELNRTLLGRPDGSDIREVAGQWLASNLVDDDFPLLALNVQICALCDMAGAYMLASRAGLSAVASLLHKDVDDKAECIELAKHMIEEAGNILAEKDRQSGPAH